MGHGIKLTEAQRDELDRHRLRATSADVFRNCLIILFSDSRDTIASIAKRLGCATDTVNRVRRLYRQGGVQALYPIKPPARTARADARCAYGAGAQAPRDPAPMLPVEGPRAPGVPE